MKGKRIVELIEKEAKLFYVELPKRLENKTLAYVYNRVNSDLLTLRWFKLATLVSCVVALLSIGLLLTFPKRTTVVFVYPHTGVEKNVTLIYGKKRREVPLTLDVEKGLWSTVIHSHKKDLPEFEFAVEEVADNGDSIDESEDLQ
ncbi:MAG: hypothetical protein ACP5QT_05565 [Brevinematia bacterium]